MAIKIVEVTIKGTSALLMHRYPLEPIEAIDKKTPLEQAEIFAYRDPESSDLYLPGVNVQRALVVAATYSKGGGRSSLQKQVAACVLVSPERISLGIKEYKIDSRRAVNPSTGGAIIRHRPRLDEWQAAFKIEFDNTLLKETEVRTIVDDMGSRVGLLDFRPQKKGPFGRSIVISWKS